jgi:hypothetical protein
MPVYYIDEASLELDRSFKDETIQMLTSTNERGERTGLVVVREVVAPGEALEGYVDRQLENIGKELNGYELLGRRAGVVDGVPSVEVRYRWLTAGELIFQQQAFVPHQSYVLTFTITSVFRAAEESARRFDHLLSTVRFRGSR